ncbi:flagellar biosynthetic protein FliR [Notoacmeibacter ruber]|uniref:Flagellar biosynthetic protein FliR n=1 Tax=Notoacmeibacter ruber TaxID=2670375 RepID=A0A3L7JEA6_9HYPH|nr:flagellar biosynthetic protein FliR [Notoacmeibacter ruber]RLQ88794.1 flagellar type III secretion system protein FliR [Notoacmeibacter ruber]
MALIVQQLGLEFFLVLCRIGGCLMILPGIGSARIPPRVRMLLVIALAAAILPSVTTIAVGGTMDGDGNLLRLIATETMIGIIIGFSVRIVVAALEFITSAIAMTIGYGGMLGPAVAEADPQASLGTFISLSALTLMFTLNFHHAVIASLVQSYQILPLGGDLSAEAVLTRANNMATDAFLMALRLGTPFLAYGIIVNLSVGLVNKLTPQIPVYFMSLPAVLLGGLLLTAATIGPLLSQFGAGLFDLMAH